MACSFTVYEPDGLRVWVDRAEGGDDARLGVGNDDGWVFLGRTELSALQTALSEIENGLPEMLDEAACSWPLNWTRLQRGVHFPRDCGGWGSLDDLRNYWFNGVPPPTGAVPASTTIPGQQQHHLLLQGADSYPLELVCYYAPKRFYFVLYKAPDSDGR